MATGGSAPVKFGLGRVMEGVVDTLCHNLNVEVVGKMLLDKEGISKILRKKIRAAVRKNDVHFFYAVLKDFDLKTLVSFLEVLQLLSVSDEKHCALYSLICSRLKKWSINPDPGNEDYIKLKAITEEGSKSKSEICFRPKVAKCPEGTTDVTSSAVDTVSGHVQIHLRPHLVETEIFSRGQQENVFYSQAHGVTVTVDQQALPEQQLLEIILTVNDYSRQVTMPKGYDASYSSLISLKSDPEFMNSVTITIPHCAIGDIEDSLCILSAPEDPTCREIHLEEDSEIEIDMIDEHYFTFRTKHLSFYKVGAKNRSSRRQKRCTSKNAKAGRDSATTKGQKLVCDARFVAVKYMRAESSSHWKCIFFVTYSNNTFMKVYH